MTEPVEVSGPFVMVQEPMSNRRREYNPLVSDEYFLFTVTDAYDEIVWAPEKEDGRCPGCGHDLWWMSCGCPDADSIY